jgi:hypothetical protein
MQWIIFMQSASVTNTVILSHHVYVYLFYFVSKETQEKYFELMNYVCLCPMSLLLTASLVENKTKDFRCCHFQNLPLDRTLSDFPLSHILWASF